MKLFTFLSLACISLSGFGLNQPPVISNMTATVNGTQITITYDLSDVESDACEVSLLLSANGGQTYLSHAGTISGDVGFPVSPGTARQIIWNFDTVSNVYVYALRLVADDRQLPSIQDIVDAVDSNQLRSDLGFIQGVRHYQANPVHLEAVKDSIENRFIAAGLETRRHDFMKDSYLGQNIIGRKAGLGKEDSTYIIDAHFDSVDDAPGADDNGSGVAGVLEALRVMAPYNFTKSIRFIGFDFEETVGIAGLEGSIQYAQTQIPSWEKLRGVANFEMIGYYSMQPNSQQVPALFDLLYPAPYALLVADSFRGNFIVNCGDGESLAFNTAFDSMSHQYVPALKVTSLTVPGNGLIAPDFRRSDHAPFWDLINPAVPAILLTDGANFRNHSYHSAGDSLGNLNFTFMSNVVKATVATIASLAGIQHSSYADFDLAPLSIPKSNFDCELQLFPVPAKAVLTVRTGDCFGSNFTFRVMDISGREVLNKISIGKRNAEIRIDKLQSGVYFGVMENNNRKVVRKFTKE